MLRARRLLAISAAPVFALLSPWALAATAGDGLRVADPSVAWPQWQARLSIVSQPLLSHGALDGSLKFGAARLMGDRYFDLGRVGDGGGVRATGAVLFGSPVLALAAPIGVSSSSLLARPNPGSFGLLDAQETGATPYVGMGYSAWWARTGLGLSADLGLLGLRSASRPLRLGRSPDGSDESWRTMQLAPVLQVNLSYSF